MPDKHKSAVIYQDFAGIFVALAAIALAATLLFDYSAKQEEADERVNHSRALYIDSQHLLVDCEKANIAVRDYQITGEPKYRAVYLALRKALLAQTANLSATTRSLNIKRAISRDLAPALQDFLSVCDRLADNASPPAGNQGGQGQCRDTHSPRLLTQANTFARLSNISSIVKISSESKISETSNITAVTKIAGANSDIRGRKLSLQDSFARLLEAIEEVRTMQEKILADREQRMAALSQHIQQTRILILLVAFIAILCSFFTLRTVMKKDRQKIASLKLAVESTKEAQKEASEALEEARRSNELKSRFMANISHEIRTPLTGILGMADLLCASDLDTTTGAYAKIMFKSSRELLSVLDDLLNFSKLERHDYIVEKKPFAIKQTIKDVLAKAHASAIEKEISLTVNVAENVPSILVGDEGKIRSVLSALVSNAIKFTPEGAVQIEVQITSEQLVRVAVIDTGIGIKPEHHGKIFEPFFQVDGGIQRIYGGTGLSLTIARRIVELMEGDIGVFSEPGSGSIFWFTFAGDPGQ